MKDIARKKPEGRKKSGRPTNRCRDAIEEGWKENIRNWKNVAKYRKE